MVMNVSTDSLKNCTVLTINRFKWVATVNESYVVGVNRSEVLDLLGEMITAENKFGLLSETGSIRSVFNIYSNKLFFLNFLYSNYGCVE